MDRCRSAGAWRRCLAGRHVLRKLINARSEKTSWTGLRDIAVINGYCELEAEAGARDQGEPTLGTGIGIWEWSTRGSHVRAGACAENRGARVEPH